MKIEMSELPKTWILDLDGTIVKHNGYKTDGTDTLLDGAGNLLSQIKEEDLVIILTSREIEYKEMTEDFLKRSGVRFDHIIYNAPYGERILINDEKPSGLKTAYAVNMERNKKTDLEIIINNAL